MTRCAVAAAFVLYAFLCLCAQLKPTMCLLLSECDSSVQTNPQIPELSRSFPSQAGSFLSGFD